jgi:N-acyl amino acid synthase of PEP-CTERM/exosortase system
MRQPITSVAVRATLVHATCAPPRCKPHRPAVLAVLTPVTTVDFTLPQPRIRAHVDLTQDDLQTEFRVHFAIARARTTAQRDESFRIRHEVYCEELAFEPVRADAKEHDEYDDGAEHILIHSVRTGTYVGCARVVLPRELDLALPIERSGAWKAPRPLFDTHGRPLVAELSRLAVIHEFRRRRGEQGTPINLADEDFGTPVRPRFPHIPVGLYLGALAVAQRRSIASLVVLTESRLAKHFGRLGVRLTQVGDAVEFHRVRAPYIMGVRETIDALPPAIRALYEWIHADMWVRV